MQKEIEGYPQYFITDDGKVWSEKSQKFLAFKDVNGYDKVQLYHEGVRKYFFVHRLVAEAFIPNPNNLPYVNHKDENKGNNNVSVKREVNGEKKYDFYKVNYHNIDFDTLTPVK